MKILVLPLGLFLLGGSALAAQEDRPADPSQGTQRAPRNPGSLDEQQRKGVTSGKQMTAEVVSVDTQGKTITVTKISKLATPGSPGSPEQSLPGTAAETKTLTVEGGAVASLAAIRQGDKVSLTCRSGSAPSSSTTPPAGSGPAGTSSDECAAVTSISKSR